MCIKTEKRENFAMPTISSFVKTICKILGVSIAQNKEVYTAKDIVTKIARFDQNTAYLHIPIQNDHHLQ